MTPRQYLRAYVKDGERKDVAITLAFGGVFCFACVSFIKLCLSAGFFS